MEKETYALYEEKMEKTISILNDDLKTVRAGRANPSVLNKITVDYYGTPTPLSQMAAIAAPEPRLLTIQPWDASMIGEVEKAIQKSDLGINPSNDGKMIRLVFQQLTEERRKELVKVISKKAEDSKVAIRSIRRDAIENFKKMEKKSEITEDDLSEMETDIQKLTDSMIKNIDEISKAKEKEILEV